MQGRENKVQAAVKAMQGVGKRDASLGNAVPGAWRAIQALRNAVQGSGRRCKGSRKGDQVSRNNVQIARNAMQGCSEHDARGQESGFTTDGYT